jgi:histidinol dehydrogenase
MLGLREVYRVGGAQAIAALAYGTKTIARVEKIVGPGNLYVTAAKKLVSFDCAIDFVAGPTEVVVLADGSSPQFIAADLVAQAEHDPQALAIFITTRSDLAKQVSQFIEARARQNPTARQSLRTNGVVLIARSREQTLDWANRIAPEHISVEPENLPFIRNAGSIFVGEYSPQAAGDYASGPNHVLPTGGAARFRGGLSVQDFVKLISVQRISRPGLRQLAPVIDFLATTEGLQAHAESVRVRCSHA